jgi:hypothetical protein
MYNEKIPTAERFEFDQGLWSEQSTDLPFRTEEDWIRIYQRLGQLALESTVTRSNTSNSDGLYLRRNEQLSAEDIRELESYFEFLRHQYGIPEGATVFPKRDQESAVSPNTEDADAA